MLITETNWVHPLGYQSEAPFLAAAYQSLTGLDAVFWVSATSPEWSTWRNWTPRFKWLIGTPTLLGQFPAAALLYSVGVTWRSASPRRRAS